MVRRIAVPKWLICWIFTDYPPQQQYNSLKNSLRGKRDSVDEDGEYHVPHVQTSLSSFAPRPSG